MGMIRYNTLKAKKEKHFTSIRIIPTKNLLTPRKQAKQNKAKQRKKNKAKQSKQNKASIRQGRQMNLTSLFGMIAQKQENPCIFRYRGFSL
jgi:tRNA A37 threonylcarbamoyladenosine dehydratase